MPSVAMTELSLEHPTSAGTIPASPGIVGPSIALAHRELVRFLRQRSRIIGALITPLMFWVFIGAGMGKSFAAPGAVAGESHGFIEYFFPGTILMILLFTAIFSTISIIEDRREGFLQGVLVAPVSRVTIALGKLLGGTVLATLQGVIFVLLAPTVGIHLTIVSFLLTLALMLIVSFALTGLGFCIAWRMSSTQGFHAIMNLFLIPLWFLSGALFPANGAMGGLKYVMLINPLTYGLAGIRRALYWHQSGGTSSLPGWGLCLGVSVAFALAMWGLSSMMVRRSTASLV
jgi:ABC-2 type transport system permease protein